MIRRFRGHLQHRSNLERRPALQEQLRRLHPKPFTPIMCASMHEIREHAYAQIASGGPTALSLNGIAKAMAARDELLTTLVIES